MILFNFLGGSIYNGNTLKITSVHKEDRGTYYCFADNEVGRGDRRSVNLEIEFPPVITVPRSRMSQAVRNDIDLECHIEAYPPPQVSRELFQSFFSSSTVNTPQLKSLMLFVFQYRSYGSKTISFYPTEWSIKFQISQRQMSKYKYLL